VALIVSDLVAPGTRRQQTGEHLDLGDLLIDPRAQRLLAALRPPAAHLDQDADRSEERCHREHLEPDRLPEARQDHESQLGGARAYDPALAHHYDGEDVATRR